MALDIDDWMLATGMLMLSGIDLQSLYDAPDAVVIDSGRPGHGKLLYAMPFGLALPTKRIDLDGRVIYEMRCATADGLTVQDVLPPTIHPDTQQPYRWAGRGHWSRLPTIPDALLTLWHSMLEQPTPAPAPAPVELGQTTIRWAEVESALRAVPASCSREEWIHCGMALHHAATELGILDQAFDLWDSWSSAAVLKYPGRHRALAQWRSFRSDKTTMIRVNTLFLIAGRYGWKRPTVDASALFAKVGQPAAPLLPSIEMALQDGKPPMPKMQTDWWPEPLRRRAVEISEHVGCDPIVPLFAGLAAVAGAIDARSRLRLMDGYEVPPVVWLMTIGSPADKKTPGSAPMIEPLRVIEADDIPRWRKALLAWEAQEALYTAQKKDYLQAAATGSMDDALPHVIELPPQPQPLRITVADVTSQKLVRQAAERPRGLLCFLDEMGAWTRKVADKNSGEDRSAWVMAYEARRYEMDRVGGGTVIADPFAVAVYGNIQPLVLKAALEVLATDGLLQRFVPGVLDTRLTRRGNPEATNGGAEWETLVRLVHSLPTITYTLSPQAFDLFRQFQLWFEQSKRDEVLLDESESAYLTAYGKLEGTTARIALLWHVIESPFATEVSRDTLQRAIWMTRGYIIPALRYTLRSVGNEPFDVWMQDYLLYHCEGRDRITLSDIKRGARRRMERVPSAQVQDQMVMDAMLPLEQARWVMRIDDGTRVHQHYAEWAINPSIREAFTDQRRQVIMARQRLEDERRRIARVDRRIVAGYDPAWDAELYRDTGT